MTLAKMIVFLFYVLGCVAIGAYLVVSGHPWFGLLAMAIGVCGKYRDTNDDDAHKKNKQEVQL